jgi:hypothetical protein
MLKPNLFGNSANSLWRSVPLPTPDGPESTRGGSVDICRSGGGFNPNRAVISSPLHYYSRQAASPLRDDSSPWSYSAMGCICCRPTVRNVTRNSNFRLILTIRVQPVDFDADVNLFHFALMRCVGKGAFGKASTHASSSVTL